MPCQAMLDWLMPDDDFPPEERAEIRGGQEERKRGEVVPWKISGGTTNLGNFVPERSKTARNRQELVSANLSKNKCYE